MSAFDRYPAVDADGNFPPEVNLALVNSAQFSSTYLSKTEAEEKYISETKLNGKVSKNELVVNVMDFGAKGDGVTDDTAAIQEALIFGTGKIVWFPGGYQYRITNSLRILQSTRIDAHMAYIFADWPLPLNDKSMVINGYSGDTPTEYNGNGDLEFNGGIWDARGHLYSTGYSSTFSLAHADGIRMTGVTMRNIRRGHAFDCTANRKVRITNCKFEGYTDVGQPRLTEAIQLDLAVPNAFPLFGAYDGTPTTDVVITGCTFGPSEECGVWPRGVGSHGTRVDKPHTNIVIHANIIEASESAVRAYNYMDTTISDNVIKGCSILAFAIDATTPSDETKMADGTQTNASAPMRGIVIRGNNIVSPATHGVYIGGFPTSGVITGTIVTGNYIQLSSISSSGANGIYILENTSALVDDNVIRNAKSEGIRSSNSRQCILSKNVISNAEDHGIMMDGCVNSTVATNTITNPLNHGISLSGSGSDNSILNNSVVGASMGTNLASYGIRLNSVQNCQVIGNMVRRGSAANRAAYGFNNAGGASGTFYTGNDFRTSGVTGSILDSGTGSITTASAA